MNHALLAKAAAHGDISPALYASMQANTDAVNRQMRTHSAPRLNPYAMQRAQQALFDSSFTAPSALPLYRGKLSPSATNAFIQLIVDAAVLWKGNARIVRMPGPQMRIPNYNVTQDPLIPAISCTQPAVTAAASVTEVTLETKEMIALSKICDDELEDAADPNFRQTFMELLARRVSNQLERTALTAVKTTGTPADTYGLFDGWRTRIVNNGGHLINAAGATFTANQLQNSVKSMPLVYMGAGRQNQRFFVTQSVYEDFTAAIGNRNTPLGDQVLINGYPALKWGGIPIIPVTLAPQTQFRGLTGAGNVTTVATVGVNPGDITVTLAAIGNFVSGDYVSVASATAGQTEVRRATGVAGAVVNVDSAFKYAHAIGQAVTRGTGDAGDIILTQPNNFIMGIQRDIRIEYQRDARERAYYVVVTMRTDFAIENADAAVMVTNVTSPLT